jgi:hypothetical protein
VRRKKIGALDPAELGVLCLRGGPREVAAIRIVDVRIRAVALFASFCRLAQRLERCAQLGAEKLRLFPGRLVPAFVDLIEINDLVISLLCPAPRRLIVFTRKDVALPIVSQPRRRRVFGEAFLAGITSSAASWLRLPQG